MDIHHSCHFPSNRNIVTNSFFIKGESSRVEALIDFLPPANEVWEGYVFTHVCLSTGGGVVRSSGVCVHGRGMRGRRDVAHMPPPGRYQEIWSMSGRYASYWNAFLFSLSSVDIPLHWASTSRVFHKLDEIGNNANIGIKDFPT